jgi:hypothetical protein
VCARGYADQPAIYQDVLQFFCAERARHFYPRWLQPIMAYCGSFCQQNLDERLLLKWIATVYGRQQAILLSTLRQLVNCSSVNQITRLAFVVLDAYVQPQTCA